MSSVFRFKQFSISQDHSAMKVGTDGVLLGAWVQLEGVKSVLDVGTGTGLISLMMAQRSEVAVTAIELDTNACIDAKTNFEVSPWGNRIKLIKVDLIKFNHDAFDLVVSNPPFFVNAFKAQDENRIRARHDESLSFHQLLDFVIKSKSKRLAVIYPFDRLPDIEQALEKRNWHIARICYVFPTPDKACSRVLLEITAEKKVKTEEHLIIEEFGRHQYSSAYIRLTKDFYLKM